MRNLCRLAAASSRTHDLTFFVSRNYDILAGGITERVLCDSKQQRCPAAHLKQVKHETVGHWACYWPALLLCMHVAADWAQSYITAVLFEAAKICSVHHSVSEDADQSELSLDSHKSPSQPPLESSAACGVSPVA